MCIKATLGRGISSCAGGVAITLAMLSSPTPAHAGLTICNKTPYKVEVASAFFQKDPPGVSTGGHSGGTVHGWSAIEPGACLLVDRNVANAGTFYYYAQSVPNARHKWGGDGRLCVTRARFRENVAFLMGNAQCPGNRQERGFASVESSTIEVTRNLILHD